MPSAQPLRWGFLNTSRIAASAYVPAIRGSRNGTLHAVASRSPDKARAFATQHGFAKAHASYDDLLADPEVEAVYISLPNALHAPWALRAADAGKPTLVDKPLCATAAEAEHLVAHFRARGVPLAEAAMYRFHPLNIQMRELLLSGAIGKLVAVRTSFFGVDANPGDDIRFSEELAGGALRDLGFYGVNAARWVVGEEPVAVRGAVRWRSPGVDQTATASLAFPSGVTASVACGFGTPFSISCELVGTEGRILNDHGAMVAWPGTSFTLKWWKGLEPREITLPPANHYQLTAEAFVDAVRGVAPFPTPPEDAVANLRVLDAILADARR